MNSQSDEITEPELQEKLLHNLATYMFMKKTQPEGYSDNSDIIPVRDDTLAMARDMNDDLFQGLLGYFTMGCPEGLETNASLEEWSRIEHTRDRSRNLGVEEKMEELLNSGLEGYMADATVFQSPGGAAWPVLRILKLEELITHDIDGRTVEEWLIDSSVSVNPLSHPGYALPEKGRSVISLDKFTTGIDNDRERRIIEEDFFLPLQDVMLELLATSDTVDDKSKEALLESCRMHELEHLRYTIDDDLMKRCEEAGYFEGRVREYEYEQALMELTPLLLEMRDAKYPMHRLVTYIHGFVNPYVQSPHQPAVRVILSLLCEYNEKHGHWFESDGLNLKHKMRNFDQLTKEQVREAAGHWYDKFYYLRDAE